MKQLDSYLNLFLRLRRDKNAPNKPILLLAVMRMYAEGKIIGGRVDFSPELITAFKAIRSQVDTSDRNVLIGLPFWHMKSEGFWTHVARTGFERLVSARGVKITSAVGIDECIDYVQLPMELDGLLRQPQQRATLEQAVLRKYFPDFPLPQIGTISYENLRQMKEEIEQASPEDYKAHLLSLQKSLSQGDFEEEVVKRSGIFRREVIRIYDQRCAISGLGISSISGTNLLDACHIRPFAVSFDDTLSNGIALTPTLHRAFDRGLIEITQDFRVSVSGNFEELGDSEYSIRQFDGREIRLPIDKRFWPRCALG